MSTRKDVSRRNAPEQKKPAPEIKSIPEASAQKIRDIQPAVSHSQDADRHRRIAHQRSEK